MTFRTRSIVALLAAVVLAHPAQAQISFATFGGVEIDGADSQLGLLGTAISKSGRGWSPVLTVLGMVARQKFGTETVNTTTFAPSIGIQNTGKMSNWSVSVGYSLVSSDVAGAGFGLRTGGEDSPFVTGQYNYWGTGKNFVEAIGSYATEPEYLWSRGRVGHQMGTSQTSLGGELIFQSGSGGSIVQVGPLLRFKASPALSFDLSGGLRSTSGGGNSETGWYIAADFLVLTPSP